MKSYLKILIISFFVLGSVQVFATSSAEIITLFWQTLPEQTKPKEKIVTPPGQLPFVANFKYEDDGKNRYQIEISILDSPATAGMYLFMLESQSKADRSNIYSKIKISNKYDAVTSIPVEQASSNFTKFAYLPAPGKNGVSRYVITIRFEGGLVGEQAKFNSWVTKVLENLPLAALKELP
ncbi:MAG: hypothetical protein Q7U04_18240 [Bacteriovorax sp.]|nr:hypothetical protein [Bacteriovorax sp.]